MPCVHKGFVFGTRMVDRSMKAAHDRGGASVKHYIGDWTYLMIVPTYLAAKFKAASCPAILPKTNARSTDTAFGAVA